MIPCLLIGGAGRVRTVEGVSFVLPVIAAAFPADVYPVRELRRVEAHFGRGLPCYLDHAYDRDRRHDPGTLVGRFWNAHWCEALGGIVADLRPEANWAPYLPRLARLGYGFSVDLQVSWQRLPGNLDNWVVVKEVQHIHSVDLVDKPALGGRFLGTTEIRKFLTGGGT